MKLIKYLRLEAGIGQGELARLMGTTQPALSAWENGKGTMPEERRRTALKELSAAASGLRHIRLEDLDEELENVLLRKS